jgi:acyl carrier protein
VRSERVDVDDGCAGGASVGGAAPAAVEGRLRGLLGELLAVDGAELAPETSLTDDLAADSLDLLEMELAVEAEFGVSIPERTLAGIRTYGDLTEAVAAAVERRCRLARGGEARPPRVVGIVGAIRRTAVLTPYAAELIAEDALAAGRGASLEIVLLDGTGQDFVRSRLGWLAHRGIDVRIRRQGADP